uniref:Uncharacterized protein n=1 Tax=Nelumbo nucifera TaxID=4432 RepID=A0A822YMA6_NELNU|nr:TPA_asm: hypothetical protein HUJ06_012591 [Nelumbo nucifera]
MPYNFCLNSRHPLEIRTCLEWKKQKMLRKILVLNPLYLLHHLAKKIIILILKWKLELLMKNVAIDQKNAAMKDPKILIVQDASDGLELDQDGHLPVENLGSLKGKRLRNATRVANAVEINIVPTPSNGSIETREASSASIEAIIVAHKTPESTDFFSFLDK